MRSRTSSSFGRATSKTARRTLRFGVVSPVLVLASSCSLVYDLSPDQCGETPDCAKFGETYECRNGVCVDTAPPGSGGRGGSAGSSGSTGKGGTDPTGGTTGATAGTAGTLGDGGTGAEGGSSGGTSGSTGKGGSSSGKGGSSGTDSGGDGGGGEGGTPFEPECSNHATCLDKYGDVNPRACVDGLCVPLKTEECPVTIPLDDANYATLRSNAYIIGAFAPAEGGLISAQSYNYDLAVREFNNTANGIRIAGGTRRKLVMVVCDALADNPEALLPRASHLMDDLKVRAVVGSLLSADQQYVVEEKAVPTKTFTMLSLNGDRSLFSVPDDGLVWTELADGDSLAKTYQPLIDMSITHLQNNGSIADLGTEEYEAARIGLVIADDDRLLADLGGSFRDLVRWNGNKTAGENQADGNFLSVNTDSHYSNPEADQSVAANQILAINPHIIVLANEFETIRPGGLIEQIEENWANDVERASQPRPLYILSPFVFGYPAMTYILDNFGEDDGYTPAVQKRMLGLNWPAAEDRTIYNAYQGRFDSAYPTVNLDNLENFYDSAYYLIYAIAAARAPLVDGREIAEGMVRVINGTQSFAVGPDQMADALGVLAVSDSRIQLIGAMGPPNWNSAGGRDDPASVWCYGSLGIFQPDRLRLDEESGMLEGSFPSGCFTFPAP